MNTRRRLLIALGASTLAVSLRASAQAPKVHRIGILNTGGSVLSRFTEFFLELRRLGYIEGQNVSFIVRSAENQLERLPNLATELVSEKVDVIFAPTTPATQAARQATASIPIVFAVVTDPVGSGFVQSLARPGYNMTGTSNVNVELSAKRLEILKELVPKASRVAVLVTDEANVWPQLSQIQMAAKLLGIDIRTVKVLSRDDFASIGKDLRAWRANAIFVAESITNSLNAQLLADFAAKLRLPAMYASDRYTAVGGLMCYGPNFGALYKRSAYYIDRILKGARPADLPVELPTHYELVINMKTAKTLGIKVPKSLLDRADRVIT